MQVRCVIFDIDGVLVDTARMVKAGQESVALRLGITRADDELYFFEAWQNLAVLLGSPISEFFLECLVEECKLQGVSLKRSGRLLDDFLAGYWRKVRAVPNARNALRELGVAGTKLAVLSDGDSDAQLRKLQLAGLREFFDPPSISIASSGSEYAKPNPVKLSGLISTIGVDFQEAAYVGDRESDVLVARLCGCLAVRFVDGREHPNVNAGLRAVRSAAGDSLHLTVPDLTVASFSELSARLSAPGSLSDSPRT